MKTTNQKIIKLKSGEEIPAGDVTSVYVNKQNPGIAHVYCRSLNREIKLSSLSLYRWFDDFENATLSELQVSIFDGACNSITGDMVEPDGWDANGFPSKLLAAGMG